MGVAQIYVISSWKSSIVSVDVCNVLIVYEWEAIAGCRNVVKQHATSIDEAEMSDSNTISTLIQSFSAEIIIIISQNFLILTASIVN